MLFRSFRAEIVDGVWFMPEISAFSTAARSVGGQRGCWDALWVNEAKLQARRSSSGRLIELLITTLRRAGRAEQTVGHPVKSRTALAFLHGYLLGKSGRSTFNIDDLHKQTSAFIEYCLDNPSERAVDAMTNIKS